MPYYAVMKYIGLTCIVGQRMRSIIIRVQPTNHTPKMIARSQKSSQIQNQVQRPPNQQVSYYAVVSNVCDTCTPIQISLIMAELSRADSVAPPLNEIVSAIKEITDPHGLGVQLRVEDYQLEIFEKNHPGDVERQKFEVIKHWRNNSECSWDALASAVEKMGKHGNLVTQLRERHLQALGMSKAKVIKTDTYIQGITSTVDYMYMYIPQYYCLSLT